jgi:hypothetical protein
MDALINIPNEEIDKMSKCIEKSLLDKYYESMGFKVDLSHGESKKENEI